MLTSRPRFMRYVVWFLAFSLLWLPQVLLAQFTTQGNTIALSNDCFRLTAATPSQTGAVWANTPLNLNAPFDLKGQIFLGCSDAGADGLAFVLQTGGTGIIGVGGGSVGYGGILNSVAVEFDTWANTAAQPPNLSDPTFDHLALVSGGVLDHAAATNLAGPVGILPGNANAEDCQYHDVRFTWDPTANVFEVYVDCQLRLTYNGDIRAALGGSTSATYGYTAATGGAANQHEACFLSNSQPGSNTALTLCQGDTLTLTAGPGTDHSWSPGAGLSAPLGQSVEAFPVVSTTYFVNYVDACGFQVEDTFDLTVSPINNIPVNLGPDFTLCPQEDSLLDPGLPATFTYLWQDGSTGPTLTAQGPGQYVVTVRDGCDVGRDTLDIGPGSIPTPAFNLQDSICPSDLTNITLTSAVLSGANYNWTLDGATIFSGGGTSNQQVFWNTPGTKTVCLSVDRLGCAAGPICDNIVVKERPLVLLDPVPDQCFPGNSFTFNVVVVGDTPDVYQWDFGSSALPPSFTGPNPPPVTYQATGIKTVTLNVTRDGCQAANATSSTFEVLQVPEAVFSPSAVEICAFEEVDFTYNGTILGPNQTFQWDFGDNAVPTSSTLPNPFPVQYQDSGQKIISLTVSRGPCSRTYRDTIFVQPSPQITAGPDTSFCEGDGGVQLLASATGGRGSLSYLWDCNRPPGNCGFSAPNILQPTVNPDPGGSLSGEVVFYLQVIDSSGCASNVDSATVTVLAKPLVDAGRDTSICEGQGVLLSASPQPGSTGIQTYQWSPAASLNVSTGPNVFATPDTTTIYTVVGIGFNGCRSEATTLDTFSTVAVVVRDKPQAFAGPDTGLCFGDSIQLQGFSAGAGPTYTYSWTGGGGISDPTSPTPFVTPTQTTIYQLTVRSNGCESDGDGITIVVDTKPTLTADASPGSVCYNDAFRLEAQASGDIDSITYRYQWTPSTGLSDPTVAKPTGRIPFDTEYEVVATSEFGCVSDTQRVFVPVKASPVVSLPQADTTVCEDDTITLTASHILVNPDGNPVNYRWLPSDFSYEFVFDSVVRVNPTRNGFIVVEAFISSGDCKTRDSVFFTVNPAITARVAADTTRFCEGLSTQLTAVGGRGNPRYQWTPALGLDNDTSGQPVASPTETTTYVVTIEEGACEAQDSLTLTVNPAPQVDFVLSRAPGCDSSLMSFGDRTTGAQSLVWDFGDGAPLSNARNPEHVYAPGTYTVLLRGVSAQGCFDSLQRGPIEIAPLNTAAFTSVPDTTEPILPTTPVQFRDSSTGAVAWLWEFGDGRMSTEANPVHRFNQPGAYRVTLTITDSVGCTYTVEQGTYQILPPDALLPTFFSPNGDQRNDVFRVEYGGNEAFELTVFDRWGRVVFTADDPSDGWDGTDGQGLRLKDGVYFYTVRLGRGTFQRTLTLLR